MALRLKNTSEIAKFFGVTSIGAFANNAAIRNNPQIIQLLLNKQAKRKPQKKYSSFENNYYKKLIESSEKIKAERQGLGAKKSTVVSVASVNITQENKLKAANQISTQVNADKNSEVTEKLPRLYWESSVSTYYQVSVERNLFGSYSLIKSWGGIKNKLGGHKITFHDDLESIDKEIKAVLKEREHKKYKLMKTLK